MYFILFSILKREIMSAIIIFFFNREGTTPTHTLSFTMEFPFEDDCVYLAYCYPYTYSLLQDRLLLIQVSFQY